MCIIGVIQSVIYPRSKSQKSVSITSGTTIWIVIEGFFIISLFVYLGWWGLELIDMMYAISAVKIFLTWLKYAPQVSIRIILTKLTRRRCYTIIEESPQSDFQY